MLYKLLLISTFIITSSLVFGQDKSNAGILPYCFHSGELYMLLGRDSNQYQEQYWTDFIGGHKTIDNNNKLKTAFREFMEETRNVFDSCDILTNLITAEPIKLSTAENTFRYIIIVNYIPVGDILDKPFYKRGQGDTEKIEYCWIKVQDLLSAVDIAPGQYDVLVPSYCIGKHLKLDKRMYHELHINNPSKVPETRSELEKLLKVYSD